MVNRWILFPDLTDLRLANIDLAIEIINGKKPRQTELTLNDPRPNFETDVFHLCDASQVLYYIGLVFGNSPVIKFEEGELSEEFIDNLLKNKMDSNQALLNFFREKVLPKRHRPKTIYVAGKWFDKDRIRKMQQNIVNYGFLISHDWTDVETKHKYSADKSIFRDCDISAAVNSYAVVAVLDDPEYPYRGTTCEITAADSHGVPVILRSIHSHDHDMFRYNMWWAGSNTRYVSTDQEMYKLLRDKLIPTRYKIIE